MCIDYLTIDDTKCCGHHLHWTDGEEEEETNVMERNHRPQYGGRWINQYQLFIGSTIIYKQGSYGTSADNRTFKRADEPFLALAAHFWPPHLLKR
jgi:hypothetical protein